MSRSALRARRTGSGHLRPVASRTVSGIFRFASRWLGRQDSNLGSRDQNPLPYRLATPQRARGKDKATGRVRQRRRKRRPASDLPAESAGRLRRGRKPARRSRRASFCRVRFRDGSPRQRRPNAFYGRRRRPAEKFTAHIAAGRPLARSSQCAWTDNMPIATNSIANMIGPNVSTTVSFQYLPRLFPSSNNSHSRL